MKDSKRVPHNMTTNTRELTTHQEANRTRQVACLCNVVHSQKLCLAKPTPVVRVNGPIQLLVTSETQ